MTTIADIQSLNRERLVYSDGSISSEDGTSLFYRSWQISGIDIRATIIFIHGIGLHSGSGPYGERVPILELLNNGVAFYSIDLRGHGRSGGDINTITNGVLVKDLESAVKFVKSKHPGDIYIYGHNFGGMLAIYYASLHNDSIKGVIVSEYSTRIKNSVYRIRRPSLISSAIYDIIGLVSPRSKKYEFLSKEDYEKLCSRYHMQADKNIIESLEESGEGPNCVAYHRQFFVACGVGREKDISKNVNVPVLMIFSRNDPFFDIKGSYDILTSLGSYDKEISLVDSSSHYEIIEKGQGIVTKWISVRLQAPKL
jgi:pimeloyl-ACP methyl ester carboxylesterase